MNAVAAFKNSRRRRGEMTCRSGGKAPEACSGLRLMSNDPQQGQPLERIGNSPSICSESEPLARTMTRRRLVIRDFSALDPANLAWKIKRMIDAGLNIASLRIIGPRIGHQTLPPMVQEGDPRDQLHICSRTSRESPGAAVLHVQGLKARRSCGAPAARAGEASLPANRNRNTCRRNQIARGWPKAKGVQAETALCSGILPTQSGLTSTARISCGCSA